MDLNIIPLTFLDYDLYPKSIDEYKINNTSSCEYPELNIQYEFDNWVNELILSPSGSTNDTSDE